MNAPMLRRGSVVLWMTGALLLLGAGAALAFWVVSVSYAPTNYALAGSSALPQGSTPGTPTKNAPNGNTVTITFSPVSIPGPPSVAATAYVITRYPAAGGAGTTTAASCTLAATVTCIESSVPDGSWTYSDAARYASSWRGADSALSASFTVDTTAPSVTIEQAATQPDPTNSSAVTFTATFSETVTGFTNSDVIAGGTAAGTKSAVVSGTGPVYTITVSGATGNGTITATIPAGAAQDLSGNNNTASSSTDNTVTLDTTSPSVTINQASGQSDPSPSGTVAFTAIFSETVIGFTSSDVTLSGTAGGTKSIAITGTGPSYSVTVSGATNGTLTASIGASTVQDLAGNSNTASTSGDNTVTVSLDTTPPTVTINQAAGQADPTNAASIDFTAVFSETVTGFTSSDVTLTGTAGGTKTVSISGSGPTYTVTVSGATTGTVIATIGAGTVQDLGGNNNTASSSTDNSITLDTTAPSVTDVLLTNGAGTTGKLDQGDKITLTYSEVMDASKFCSAWVNDGSSQAIIGGNDVTVTISDVAGVETMSMSSTSCSGLKVGTVRLGAQYLQTQGTSATFAGTGSNSSRVTWNPTSKTFVIQLGNPVSGTPSTGVAAAAVATYTPVAGLSDLVGNALSTTSVNGTTASRF